MDETVFAAQPAGPDFAAIQRDYESGMAASQVCARHGISDAQLRYRREQDGWLTQRRRQVNRAALMGRLFRILQTQIIALEQAVDTPIDKQAAVLGTMVKTLDQLNRMEKAERAKASPAEQRDMAELRLRLAKRIEQLRNA